MSVRNGLVVFSLVLSILIGVSLSRSDGEGVAAGGADDGLVIGLSMDTLNGMTLLAVSPEIKFIARGTVLVLAVWMDVWIWRKR